MSDNFVCSICGEEHQGLMTDWAYKLPDEVWAIPEGQRPEQARYNDDLCQWGDRFFFRCVLLIPFTEMDGEFGWGAWAEVDQTVFWRYYELYEQDAADEPLHTGKLANALSPYEGSIGTSVRIQFRDRTKRPVLYLADNDHSLLAQEQRHGIDNARYHEIADAL